LIFNIDKHIYTADSHRFSTLSSTIYRPSLLHFTAIYGGESLTWANR